MITRRNLALFTLTAVVIGMFPISAAAQLVDESTLYAELQKTQQELRQRKGKNYVIDGDQRVMRQRELLQMISAFEESFPNSDKMELILTEKLSTMHNLVNSNFMNPADLQKACEEVLSGNPNEELSSNAAYRLIDAKVKLAPASERNSMSGPLYEDYVNQYPTSRFASSAYQMLIKSAEGRSDLDALKKYAAYLRANMPEDRATRKANSALLELDGIGKPLSIQYTSMEGEKIDTSAMKGKVVGIFFWASWCGSCKKAKPGFQEVYERYHDQGLEMVTVSLDSQTQLGQLERTIKQTEFAWPISFNGKSWTNPLAVQFGVGSLPTILLIDRQGNLAYTDARTNFEQKVKELIEKPATSTSSAS
jgi:thiol-disulfide isomerase/thioredoxin